MEKRRIEILAPAGSYASFKAAINAGADAVYAGGPKFGARAYADNFTKEELIEAIKEAHIYGRKLYLTVNTLLKNNEISELPEYLSPLYEAGVDAVIVQDIGVLELVREYFPKMDIHASTQMTITGYRGAAFMEGQGISRVVPARELSLEEVRMIKEKTGLEIECFVHGALCYCYSGQCLLSSILFKSERYLYAGSDPGTCGGGNRFVQDRRSYEKAGVCSGSNCNVPEIHRFIYAKWKKGI